MIRSRTGKVLLSSLVVALCVVVLTLTSLYVYQARQAKGETPPAEPAAEAPARPGIEARDGPDQDASSSDRALSESVAAAAAMASSEAETPAEPEAPAEPDRAPARIARVVAVANQKGGVGKSTTAVSLGAALAELGNLVLVIDLTGAGTVSTGKSAADVTLTLSGDDLLALAKGESLRDLYQHGRVRIDGDTRIAHKLSIFKGLV